MKKIIIVIAFMFSIINVFASKENVVITNNEKIEVLATKTNSINTVNIFKEPLKSTVVENGNFEIRTQNKCTVDITMNVDYNVGGIIVSVPTTFKDVPCKKAQKFVKTIKAIFPLPI